MAALAVEITEKSLIIMTIASVCGLAILTKAVCAAFQTASRERSRREIAAYIAEGTITPDQGERLMRAGADGAGNTET